jgi:hypothetical protein
MATRPEHRLSNKTKRGEKWYENAYDYYIGLAKQSNNKEQVKEYLDAANSVISKKVYEYVLSPLIKDGVKTNSIPSIVRDVDIIAPIRDRQISEYVTTPYIKQVLVNNAEILIEKDASIRNSIIQLYEDYVVYLMNQQGVETGVDIEQEPQVDKTLTEFAQEMLDDRAIQGQQILDIIEQDNDFDIQRIGLYFDWWSTEQFYTYRYIDNGEFYRIRVPVLEAYPIDNGEEFVEDMEGFVRIRKISFEEAKSKYRNLLSKADMTILDNMIKTSEITNDYGASITTVSQLSDKYSGVTQTDVNGNLLFTTAGGVLEHTIIFKTEVKVNIVTYDNGKGDLLEKRVDSNYQLNPELGDVEMNEEWIEEVWIGYKLGDSGIKLSVPPKPALIQRYDSRFRCKLPVGGKVGIINGMYINPIPYKLLSYLALFRIFTYKQEALIAKYKGSIMTIPKSVLASSELTAKQQYFYMREDGSLIYDDAEISPQTLQYGFRVLSDEGLERVLITLNELRRQIKEEAWELANMNNARVGNIEPRAGKAVTEQSIFRAKMASNLMIYMFNKALEKDHLADLEWSKVAYIDGKTGYYRNNLDEPVFYNIDGIRNLESDYTVFVKNSEIEEQKLQQYKELAFSAAQNGEMELSSIAINSLNSVEIKRAMDKYYEAKREFELQIEGQKQQTLQMEHELRLNEITTKEDKITERELAKIEMEREGGGSMKEALDEARLALEERKQQTTEEHQRETRRLKEKQIESQERIARVNKN